MQRPGADQGTASIWKGEVPMGLETFGRQKSTWIVCQSLLQPAGRGAHAGDAPPETSENLQRIKTLRQRPRR